LPLEDAIPGIFHSPGVLTTTTESSIVLFLFGKPTPMLMRIS
jgi:hypothetical protein